MSQLDFRTFVVIFLPPYRFLVSLEVLAPLAGSSLCNWSIPDYLKLRAFLPICHRHCISAPQILILKKIVSDLFIHFKESLFSDGVKIPVRLILFRVNFCHCRKNLMAC